MKEMLDTVLGQKDQIEWWQMGVRAVIIFIVALIIIRAGDRRIFGKTAALDIVLGIILGSVLSRAITGNAPFCPAIFASIVLMDPHWLVAYLAFHFHSFGKLIKGREIQLVRFGNIEKEAMAKTKITEHDLAEAWRQNSIEDILKVRNAYIERNGNIYITKPE